MRAKDNVRMNFELFIARRIHFARQGKKSISRPAVRVAQIGVAVGLAVVIVAMAIVLGYKREVGNKVVGFGSHIQISNFDSNSTYESAPIVAGDSLMNDIRSVPGVAHAQRFATKTGILKTKTDFQAVVFKGIDQDFDWDFFKTNLKEGNILQLNDSTTSNGVIISSYLSKLMKLNLGDSFLAYFVQDRLRVRKFTIEGIYSTNFQEFDELFVISDIRHIRKLNDWDDSQSSGIEVPVNDFDKVDEVRDRIADKLYGAMFLVRSVRELHPEIFAWLDLLDMNVWVILALMIGVAGFNMISGLLILILEQTNTIGILKSMGANNWSIRKIFLYHSFFLVGKGMLWGNIIGVGLCLFQHFTGFFRLNPDTYYLSTVPVYTALPSALWILLLLNVCCFVISILMLVGPSYLITKINPAKAIKFE